MNTPITDELLTGRPLGQMTASYTDVVDLARRLERDRAELIESVGELLVCMRLVLRDGVAMAIKASAILARIEGEK